MADRKLTRDYVPKGFTVGLAVLDLAPTVCFAFTVYLLYRYKFPSVLFLTGGIAMVLGGFLQFIWKLIVAMKQKNAWNLHAQMKYTMPIGMALMILSLFVDSSMVSWKGILLGIFSMPSLFLFIIAFAAMVLLINFGKILDPTKPRHNFYEEMCNTLLQFCILEGVIFLI